LFLKIDTEFASLSYLILTKLKADQSSDIAERATLLTQAVEVAETIEMPMGHQAKLYEMAANAHYQRENWEFAEKYFLIAINRYVQAGIGKGAL